jgi:hypothetical protein
MAQTWNLIQVATLINTPRAEAAMLCLLLVGPGHSARLDYVHVKVLTGVLKTDF